ncbi:hypothetical protein QYM42_08230 [Lactococcus lactis]|uniref:hypothetical protein n=1 Tax=Lactococcus lactis TaxID=1358 RepID=UPI0026580B90|nr:hypothetical protein [Lactococcus lactis]WKF72365.1 hypothetical protein QYM42_08230 [Lactococcus lactis]
MLTKKDYEGMYELEHAFEEDIENKSSLKNVENKKVTYTALYQSKNLVIYVEDKKRKPVIDIGAILEIITFLLIIVGLTCLSVFIYHIMTNQVKLSTLLNIF